MSGAPKTVAKPQQAAGGPTFMPRPVQGYQAPARTVDYSYKPQGQQGQTIASPTWAMPQTAGGVSLGGRFFPALRQPITYGANGRMNLASEAPPRTVDYGYTPQTQAPRQIQNQQIAAPQLTPPQTGGAGYNYQVGDIVYNPQGMTYDADGNQTGGPRFNTDGMYTGTWEGGLSDGT